MMNPSSGDILPQRGDESAQADRSVVQVRGLGVVKGHRPILAEVSMTLGGGEVVGLLGPSGCGKTTLMRAIVGVQRPTAGAVMVLGAVAGSRGLRGRIGYMTQQGAVYSDLSVRENVGYFAALAGGGGRELDAVIASVGLAEHARQRVATLSGGEANRVSLACALVGRPALLVLDEPTVGLDPLTREDLWRRFRELADQGCALLVSSHVMDEALRCDRLVLMRQGRVLGVFTPHSLLASTHTDSPDEAFLRLLQDRDLPAGADREEES